MPKFNNVADWITAEGHLPEGLRSSDEGQTLLFKNLAKLVSNSENSSFVTVPTPEVAQVYPAAP